MIDLLQKLYQQEQLKRKVVTQFMSLFKEVLFSYYIDNVWIKKPNIEEIPLPENRCKLVWKKVI